MVITILNRFDMDMAGILTNTAGGTYLGSASASQQLK